MCRCRLAIGLGGLLFNRLGQRQRMLFCFSVGRLRLVGIMQRNERLEKTISAFAVGGIKRHERREKSITALLIRRIQRHERRKESITLLLFLRWCRDGLGNLQIIGIDDEGANGHDIVDAFRRIEHKHPTVIIRLAFFKLAQQCHFLGQRLGITFRHHRQFNPVTVHTTRPYQRLRRSAFRLHCRTLG